MKLRMNQLYIDTDRLRLRNHSKFRGLAYKGTALCSICNRRGTWYWYDLRNKAYKSPVLDYLYLKPPFKDTIKICSEACLNMFLLQKAL